MPLTGVQNIATNQRMNEWQRRAKPLSVTTAQTDGIGAPQPPQKNKYQLSQTDPRDCCPTCIVLYTGGHSLCKTDQGHQ